MTAQSYAHMDTDALIEEFARLVKASSSALELLPNPTMESVARHPQMKELLAVGGELRARKPIEKLRRLFDHESKDVRTSAGAQLLSLDEEWALAAIASGRGDPPTREIVALRQRARRGPPARPALNEMSVEQLAARFEDAGMRRYAATRFMGGEDEAWDVELANRIIGEMMDITDELKSRDAHSGLLPLLGHSNVCVRNDAASRCLSLAPDQAVPVLEAIRVGPDPIERMGVGWPPDRWREKNTQAPAP